MHRLYFLRHNFTRFYQPCFALIYINFEIESHLLCVSYHSGSMYEKSFTLYLVLYFYRKNVVNLVENFV